MKKILVCLVVALPLAACNMDIGKSEVTVVETSDDDYDDSLNEYEESGDKATKTEIFHMQEETVEYGISDKEMMALKIERVEEHIRKNERDQKDITVILKAHNKADSKQSLAQLHSRFVDVDGKTYKANHFQTSVGEDVIQAKKTVTIHAVYKVPKDFEWRGQQNVFEIVEKTDGYKTIHTYDF